MHPELEPDQRLADRNGNVAAKRDLDKLGPKTKRKCVRSWSFAIVEPMVRC